jgi:GMP synthase-like glutamine amidotransferase
MPILAFRHVPFEPIGLIADALDVRRMEWRYVDLWETWEPDLSVETATALIVMGGPMSVNDPLPWLRLEERYIVRAISSDVPVLGICLGAQLLAKCLGATVRPMGHKEIGWYPVRFTECGASDPLFQGLPGEEIFFHWHGENFTIPEGAERLAESDLCANQAFRLGSRVYGLQFHPEVTPEIIASWLQEDACCGDAREANHKIEPKAHAERAREVAAQIFGRWCDLVATR